MGEQTAAADRRRGRQRARQSERARSGRGRTKQEGKRATTHIHAQPTCVMDPSCARCLGGVKLTRSEGNSTCWISHCSEGPPADVPADDEAEAEEEAEPAPEPALPAAAAAASPLLSAARTQADHHQLAHRSPVMHQHGEQQSGTHLCAPTR